MRALAALAGLDPESERWKPLAGPLAQQLVSESPLLVGEWLKVFQPVRLELLPPLAAIYRVPLLAGSDADLKRTLVEYQRKAVAVSWLGEYAFDEPARLADYLMDADADQWAVLWPAFARVRLLSYAESVDLGIRFSEPGTPAFLGELAKTLPKDLPSSDPQRETLAKRQANAGVALLRLNQPAKVWPLLKHSPDPRVRSYLIHRLSPLGADAKAIVKQLDDEKDLTIRGALLLSLGEFKETDFTPDERKAVLPKVQEVYRTASDPGLHAASEWLLRTWKQEAWLTQVNEEWAKDGEGRDKRMDGIKKQLASRVESAPGVPPQWYVNTQGQTFVVIPGPVEFRMGSPKIEKDREEREAQHKRRIGRSFAIASKSVTLEEYRSLTKEKHEIGEKYTHSPDLPVVGMSWYMAAIYCNLLSKKEGIPEDQWCYEMKGKDSDYAGTSLRANYLSLTGYRLPTEAEMEYATRAGAGTSRYYGETDELLTHYAWYAKNAGDLLERVGLKKPNEFGLFDAQGNCFTWCQEPFGEYQKAEDEGAIEDKEVDNDKLSVVSTNSRVLRGGSFFHRASIIRSSFRSVLVPTSRNNLYGFRVARTFAP